MKSIFTTHQFGFILIVLNYIKLTSWWWFQWDEQLMKEMRTWDEQLENEMKWEMRWIFDKWDEQLKMGWTTGKWDG